MAFGSRKLILVVASYPRSLVNFRKTLLQSMVSNGHSVVACADGRDLWTERQLEAMGVEYRSVRIARAGMNPLADARTLLALLGLIAEVRPHVVLAYTMKPVIYAGLAARWARVPEIHSLVTGLGYAFMPARSPLHRVAQCVATLLLRSSLAGSKSVFFQNPDDQELFISRRLVRPSQTFLLDGSGVDLEHFAPAPLPHEPVFLMAGRLLAAKGVREYVTAAAEVRMTHPNARFLLAGDTDPNPDSVRASELAEWARRGDIEYLGYVQDIRTAIRTARFFVLPSYYREGVPRSILEAMSMGRPVITTDAPGCRETVTLTPEGQQQKERGEPIMLGENGLLVRPRDAAALRQAMLTLLQRPACAEAMGVRGREIAERRFDSRRVTAALMRAMGLVA